MSRPPIETQIILRLGAEAEENLFTLLDEYGLEHTGEGVLDLIDELREGGEASDGLAERARRFVEENPEKVQAAMRLGTVFARAMAAKLRG